MAEKYGNLPLGQVSELLVLIIGRDAALTIVDKQGIPIIGKDLDMMFKEKDVSFARFKPKEKTSVDELYRAFSEILEKEYAVPVFISRLILQFWNVYRNALRGKETTPEGKEYELAEAGLIPYDMETSKLSLLLLNWALGYLGRELGSKQKTKLIEEDFVLKDKYKKIFDDIYSKLNISKDEFYEDVKKFYIGKQLDDFEQAIKRVIEKCCKEDANEPWVGVKVNGWSKFKAILDYVYSKGEKTLVYRLIGLYLLKNTEAALKKICDIEQKDIYQIKQDVHMWAQDKLHYEPKSDAQYFLTIAGKYDPADLSLLQEHSIDPLFKEQRIAIFNQFGSYLWGKNSIDPIKAEQVIQEMEEKCPHCGIFFASWARARLAILSCKFDDSEEDKNFQRQALKGYHTAFNEGRNFAGAYLRAFLKESIAATVYFNRRRIQDIPKVIDTDESLQTPITDDVKESEKRDASYGAKQYYEYGYALNLFGQESSETYFLHFHAEEHFWQVFSTSLFIHTGAVEKRCSEDMLNAKGVHIVEGDKEEPEQQQKILKQKLKNVTEKTINTRMEVWPGHNVQYTPLSIALQCCELDIAEKYLKDFKKELDVTVINTHGSTALEEALTQYKNHRFFEQRAEQYKKIIMELIGRSPVDSLYAENKKNFISVLQNAIDGFDIEIVKAIVENKGFDIQKLKISADELSPLYYTIMRCHFVSNLISTGKITENEKRNITWEKFNVPGIFTEDKMAYHENMISDPMYKEMEKLSIYIFCGKPEIWKQELQELKEIVKYLADKTDDVDAFAKKAPNGDDTTALSLAVESDFDNICRLLIEKGANPAHVFRNNGILYDSYLFRAVWFRSRKTLEMLLIDFKEKIKLVIDEQYREERQTAAHLLFKVDYGSSIYQYSVNNENFRFIEYFIPLFRKAGAGFDIPDFRDITVRQILKEKDLEYLIK